MRLQLQNQQADPYRGVDCRIETHDEGTTHVQVFKNALAVRLVADHPFKAEVLAKHHGSMVWGLSKVCDVEIKLKDQRFNYMLRSGDTLVITPFGK